MDYRHATYLIAIFYLLFPGTLAAQQDDSSYDLFLRPDLWYNRVDGVRIGSIAEGRVAGSGHEGRHRIDAAFWVGTRWPDLPVSYRFRYTEPLSRSAEGNEFAAGAFSRILEGFQSHGLLLSRRWQMGEDYLSYWEGVIGFRFQYRFDLNYTLFPELWSDEWHKILFTRLEHRHFNRAGRFSIDKDLRFSPGETSFLNGELSITQQAVLPAGFGILIRLFGTYSTGNTPPEYLHLLSNGNEIGTLESRLTRSRGTLPSRWVEDGWIHRAGGSNLRGYTSFDLEGLQMDTAVLHRKAAAVNIELEIPNPLQHQLNQNPYTRDFLTLRTYLFGDMAAADDNSAGEGSLNRANAGVGIQLAVNIADYLGKPRGFSLRYEAPFWLSDPGEDPSWKWRHLLGIGAIFPL